MTTTTSPAATDKALRGPQQLLAWLSEAGPIEEPTINFIEMSSERLVVGWQRRTIERSDQVSHAEIPTESALVAVLQLPAATDIPEWRSWLAAIEIPAAVRVLDLLVATPDRWWSAMCTDSRCCPAAGRPIQRISATALQGWQEWRRLLNGAPTADLRQLAAGVSDIKVRDAVLITLCEPAARCRWLEFEDEILRVAADSADPHSIAATNCIAAAVGYFAGDFDRVAACISRCNQARPDYSLARLLEHGLTMQAPPALLERAFSACDIDAELADVGAIRE